MKVLIVEDDPDIASTLERHLTLSGFVTRVEHDGQEGCFLGLSGEFDAVLLDLGLPSVDGLSILHEWRTAGVETPVIVLTARGNKRDVVHGLDAGADDYVVKPFDLAEVTARVRSAIRRSNARRGATSTYANVSLDGNAGVVLLEGSPAKLTRIEYLIVQYLFAHQGRPVSITELSEHVYDDFDNDSSVIPRHVANIRKKLGAGLIRTESNRGYCVPREGE
ncbi:MAG: response regulator transcription factor [Gammaproteobacteria bacterium]